MPITAALLLSANSYSSPVLLGDNPLLKETLNETAYCSCRTCPDWRLLACHNQTRIHKYADIFRKRWSSNTLRSNHMWFQLKYSRWLVFPGAPFWYILDGSTFPISECTILA
jgi:hypothetical protein